MALNRKIAYIDLNQKKIKITPIPLEWRRKFIGGRGIGGYLASKYAFPQCNPLGSDNAVVISAGLLGGTLAAPLGCTFIMSKSPLTNLLSQVQLEGMFASEMRWAGFDHLVITGRSENPVYLYINNGTVEIKDAKRVWEKNVSQAHEQFRKDLKNEDIRILGIGPAGENLVRFATIVSDQNTISGRTGMGAVFGSKNVKAVVCRGTMDLEIKHPEEILKSKRNDVEQAADIKEKNSNGADPAGLNQTIRDITESEHIDIGFDWFSKGDFLIRELGMDPLAVRGILNWVFTLFEKGKLRAKDTDVPNINRDDSGAVLQMIHDIAHRKGYGDILAQGPFRAAGLIGYSSIKHFIPAKWLIKLYSEDASYGPFGLDETNEMILNCLGIGTDNSDDPIFRCGDFRHLIEQIRFNTGLTFNDNELKKVSYRCYALERLFNIREEVPCKGDFIPDCSFDVPSGLKMTCAMWDSIDLKTFQRKVKEYHQQRKWNKKDIFKAGVFKKLEIADLWPTVKR